MKKQTIITAIIFLIIFNVTLGLGAQTQNRMIAKKINAEMNGEWILSVMNDKKIRPNRASLYIEMSSHRIGGRAFCNSYFAKMDTLTYNEIRFSDIGSTKMACRELNLEQEFFESLNKVRLYTFKNKSLALKDKNGKIILQFLRFIPKDGDIVVPEESVYVDTTSSVLLDSEIYDTITIVSDSITPSDDVKIEVDNSKEKKNWFSRMVDKIRSWFK